MQTETKVLYATKIGQPDYMEDFITDNQAHIERAKQWCLNNGYDRIRIAIIDLSTKPDFTKTIAK